MNKKILIVIDMQNDFVTGSLGTKEAVQIVNNVKNKILSYDKDNVYATRDTHYDNYMSTQEGKNLPVEHCIIGTEGHDIVNDLKPLINENNIFDKPTFGSVELVKKVKEIYDKNNGEIEVEICGLCTDICVISNALMLKAFMPELKISLDEKCTAGVTEELKNDAIATMKSCQIQIF